MWLWSQGRHARRPGHSCRGCAGICSGRHGEHEQCALSANQSPHRYRMGDGELIDAVVRDGLWCAFENIHMGGEAEIIAEKFGVTREEQDQFSLQSHQRAAAATAAGRFKDEIVPIEIKQKSGVVVVDTDEPIRADSSLAALAKLKPAFKEGGTVTAGNAPGLSDGASATVVVDQDFAKANGLTVLARVTSYASAAITPRSTFSAPTRAVNRLLEPTGL